MAWAEVRHLAVAVRDPRVVEDLEEGVPDLGVGLLELVQQQDGEGLAPDLVGQGKAVLPLRLAEQPVQAVLGLELAHVEADHPARVAEEPLGQGLGDLGLAGAGRPGEEEDADRTGRVGDPGLQHRHPFDQAVDRLLLAHDLLGQKGLEAVEVEAAAVVQQADLEAGLRGQGDEDVVQVQRRPVLPRGRPQPVQGRVQQAEQVAGRRPVAEVLLGQVPGLGDHLGIAALDLALQPEPPQRQRVLRRQGLYPERGQGGHRLGLLLEQPLQGRRMGLADDLQLALLDQGQDHVERGGRAVAVAAGHRQGVELRYEPDHAAVAAELGDDVLQALLELADVDLARDQVVVARGEDHPALRVEPARQLAQDRGLADARLAHDQAGLRPLGEQGRLQPVDRLQERGVLQDPVRRRAVRLVPELAGRAQQALVDLERAPGLVALQQRFPEGRVQALQELPQVARLVAVELDLDALEAGNFASLDPAARRTPSGRCGTGGSRGSPAARARTSPTRGRLGGVRRAR